MSLADGERSIARFLTIFPSITENLDRPSTPITTSVFTDLLFQTHKADTLLEV
jgi:hypothetical protein